MKTINGKNYKLIHMKTKKEIQIGDMIADNDGGKVKVVDFRPGYHSGSSGRVRVKGKEVMFGEFEYFPHVYDLKIVEVEDLPEVQFITPAKDLKKVKKAMKKKGIEVKIQKKKMSKERIEAFIKLFEEGSEEREFFEDALRTMYPKKGG